MFPECCQGGTAPEGVPDLRQLQSPMHACLVEQQVVRPAWELDSGEQGESGTGEQTLGKVPPCFLLTRLSQAGSAPHSLRSISRLDSVSLA